MMSKIIRGPAVGALVRKTATAEIDENEDRTMSFVASDESVDRYGDVIQADGWELARYRLNPIFLWQHSYGDPIGTVANIGVEGKRLLARVKFAAQGVNAKADELWRLAKAKVLRAVSVGFTVNSEADYELIRNQSGEATGVRYLRQELLELSLVSVPANPNALAVARSRISAGIRGQSPTRQHDDESLEQYFARLQMTLYRIRLNGIHIYAPNCFRQKGGLIAKAGTPPSQVNPRPAGVPYRW